MKKICTFLIIALLLSVFAGCGGSDVPAPTQPSVTPTEPIVTDPVQQGLPDAEQWLFFAHPLEYSRLYAYHPVSGEVRKILDVGVYNLKQLGKDVYYTERNTLFHYDALTGAITTVSKYIDMYCPLDGGVAYGVVHPNYMGCDIFYHQISDGTTIQVSDDAYNDFGAYGDQIFFSEARENTYDLSTYSVSTGQVTLLAKNVYGYELLGCQDGLYISNVADGNWGRLFIHAQTGKIEPLYTQGQIPSLLKTTANGLYYIAYNYSEEGPSYELRYRNKEGNEYIVLKENWPISDSTQIQGDVLLIASDYVPWGEKDAYGYSVNFARQCHFYLLEESGTVRQVEIGGESAELFADGEFPLIDSSTARKPVTAELYGLFVKGYGRDGQEPICSTTHGAWLNIADRKVDLAFLAAPTEEEKAYLDQQGVDVEMKLYGGDGLVFIGNSQNPVTDLTHEQILGIYTGQITNWAELGGPDQPITVFFRDDQSGSQRLLESLVFADQDVPDFEALGFQREWEMSSIVDMTAEDPWAVGYSIMTYLDSVYENEDVKVFTVGGVAPSPDTIADSSYLYHTKGYIVIRADEPENSPARRLFNWFGCAMSDHLLLNCSVTPLSE